MLFDSHTHIHFPAFADDIDAIMVRAGDMRMLTVGTLPYSNAAAVAFAERYPNVYASVAIHPCYVHTPDFCDPQEFPEDKKPLGIIREDGTADLSDVEQYLLHPKVVAVGEFGLDFYRLPEDPVHAARVRDDQERAAAAHLALCSAYNKPATIHCRDGVSPLDATAHTRMQHLIAEEIARGGLQRRGIIHCFTGTLAQAERYIELGFVISFSGILTFAKSLQEVARRLPLEFILLETDAPYLAPVPHRGKRNEPAFLKDTAACFAHLRGISYDEAVRITCENACRVLGIVS